jgi:nucleotide-binding universal stress UspA family protein
MQILTATDLSTRSHRALRRAGLLAQGSSAELTLLHVVDDDQPAALVEIETREAERILREQISAVAELHGVRCRPAVIAGDAFDGILRIAESAKADLIVMGAHRKQLLRDILVGTTIERVIRMGPYPVLMVNEEVERPYGRALAAIDMSEPSAHAIRTAERLKLVDHAHFTLVHAFFPLAKGKMSFAGLQKESIDEYVASERGRASEELVAFLEANGLADQRWSRRIEEGEPVEVISRVVKAVKPDLLVIGTHGRSGIAKALLGSVTEEVLRSLDIDILAVPPMR